MTNEEVRKIIEILANYYRADIEINELEIGIWQLTFKDCTYSEVFKGVMAFIANDIRDYPKIPKPGQIKPYIRHIYMVDKDGRILNG